MRRVRLARTSGSTSVQTWKVFKVCGPTEVATGISVASPPRETVNNTSDTGHVMARVEGKPAPIEEEFEPRDVIHRSWIRRHADVAQKPIGVTRRNIHAAAESDREMGEIAANAHPLLIGLIGGTVARAY